MCSYRKPVWIYPTEDNTTKEQIINNFSIHPFTAQVLVARGFTVSDKICRFLYAKLPDLHDPMLFKHMEKSINYILETIKNNKGILIYGDNDVDGMTGTAVLVEFLSSIGGNSFYYIPPHNISKEDSFVVARDIAKKNNCSLLITVDCGISSHKEIAYLKSEGIEVIITDHHEPMNTVPDCISILNPKTNDQNYPNKDLTGVGVAFKLVHGLLNVLVKTKSLLKHNIDLKLYLDLVALGTISDMGTLLEENRILVRYGLKQLEHTNRQGLIQLCEICGLDKSEISASSVALKLAPRLNSLGRISDPNKGVELLLLKDETKAASLAREVDFLNVERQKIEQKVWNDVEKQLKQLSPLDNIIIFHSNVWHHGVIPVICSRIAKMYNRPTIMIKFEENGIGKGSIRTIKEFPIMDTLKKFGDKFINYGGHNYAAGFTIHKNNLEMFKELFKNDIKQMLNKSDLISKIYIDGQVDFKDLNYDFIASLDLLEPFGNNNSPPVFYCEAKLANKPKVVGGSHLKIKLFQNDICLDAIGFGLAELAPNIQNKNQLMVAYSIQTKSLLNKKKIQLIIRDIQIL